MPTGDDVPRQKRRAARRYELSVPVIILLAAFD